MGNCVAGAKVFGKPVAGIKVLGRLVVGPSDVSVSGMTVVGLIVTGALLGFPEVTVGVDVMGYCVVGIPMVGVAVRFSGFSARTTLVGIAVTEVRGPLGSEFVFGISVEDNPVGLPVDGVALGYPGVTVASDAIGTPGSGETGEVAVVVGGPVADIKSGPSVFAVLADSVGDSRNIEDNASNESVGHAVLGVTVGMACAESPT